jgi:hypothetical protein
VGQCLVSWVIGMCARQADQGVAMRIDLRNPLRTTYLRLRPESNDPDTFSLSELLAELLDRCAMRHGLRGSGDLVRHLAES